MPPGSVPENLPNGWRYSLSSEAEERRGRRGARSASAAKRRPPTASRAARERDRPDLVRRRRRPTPCARCAPARRARPRRGSTRPRARRRRARRPRDQSHAVAARGSPAESSTSRARVDRGPRPVEHDRPARATTGALARPDRTRRRAGSTTSTARPPARGRGRSRRRGRARARAPSADAHRRRGDAGACARAARPRARSQTAQNACGSPADPTRWPAHSISSAPVDADVAPALQRAAVAHERHPLRRQRPAAAGGRSSRRRARGARRHGAGMLHRVQIDSSVNRPRGGDRRCAPPPSSSTPRADKAANLETADRLVRRAAADGADARRPAREVERARHAATTCAPAPSRSTAPAITWARGARARARASTSSPARSPSASTARTKLRNTSLHVGPDGELTAAYRKIHMFDVEVDGVVLPRVRPRGARRRGGPHRDGRRRRARPDASATTCASPSSSGCSRSTARGSSPCPAAFTVADDARPLGGAAARPRDREPGVRRSPPTRSASTPPGHALRRALDDRRPVGHRARAWRPTPRASSRRRPRPRSARTRSAGGCRRSANRRPAAYALAAPSPA